VADVNDNLTTHNDTVQFYDERYDTGYMESWPEWKCERMRELLRKLPLPKEGVALEFGCGNGVFTEVLTQALPGWKVFGTDISANALDNARRRVPAAQFFLADSQAATDHTFDLVFTHHVLEHVFDLSATLDQVDAYLKPSASVLHVLPCGNPGSFEHRICALRVDGIDPERGNRYFFEDPGHLRRLNTAQMTTLHEPRKLILAAEFYSGQYAGAINWISNSGVDFVRHFADPDKAINATAARQLVSLRRKLVSIAYLRWVRREVEGRIARRRVGPLAALRLTALLSFYLIGRWLDGYWERRVAEEWANKNTDQKGSEMYLLFTRS